MLLLLSERSALGVLSGGEVTVRRSKSDFGGCGTNEAVGDGVLAGELIANVFGFGFTTGGLLVGRV